MFCHNCGNPVEENQLFCHICGARLTTSTQQPYQPLQQTPTQSNGSVGLARASMILGIISAVIGIYPSGISIACAIVALVLGVKVLKQGKKGEKKNPYALTGFICALVSFAEIVLLVLLLVFVFAAVTFPYLLF